MEVQFEFKGSLLKADLDKGFNLSSILSNKNPLKAFHAPDIEIKPFEVDGFVGDIRAGSAVNFKNVFLNPHGNGTHTECVSHIQDIDFPVYKALEKTHFIADLISVVTVEKEGDQVIDKAQLEVLNSLNGEALMIRTFSSMECVDFSGSNPPYLTAEAMAFIVEKGYQHLLIDLPSVDREEDGGALIAHKLFFEVANGSNTSKTITEMIRVPEQVGDGTYLLNIQVINLDMDASPSRIMIYPLI